MPRSFLDQLLGEFLKSTFWEKMLLIFQKCFGHRPIKSETSLVFVCVNAGGRNVRYLYF